MSINTPELILPSIAAPSDRELENLDSALERERAWYSESPRFKDERDLTAAIASGDLVQVHQSPHSRPVARFYKGGVPGFDPFLSERAWRLLHDFTDRWYDRLIDLQEDQRPVIIDLASVRLAVTSMVRHQEYQNALVAGGRLASPDSTHCTGNAFDIDASGYYLVESNGRAVSCVDERRRAASTRIGELLANSLGAMPETLSPRDSQYFPGVTQAAIDVAKSFHAEGAINLVEEFAGTENACLHIAVNPEY